MITAKEARERVTTLKTKRGKKEAEKAENLITKAIEDGESSTYLGFYASEYTVKWLEELGYEVELIDSQRDGEDTKVSW